MSSEQPGDLDRQEIIHKTVLFKDLSSGDVARVLAASQLQHRLDGTFFFIEGDPAERSYALLSGKVRLSQVTMDGQQVLFGYIGPGREFGIIALLGELTYPVSAQAVGDSLALVWDKHALGQLMDEIPQITRNALYIMARQIREFQGRIRDLSTQRVERRLARTLLRLAKQSGHRMELGILIDLPLTRQDLAELSGTTMYTASRIISQWEEQGIVLGGRERVIITRPHELVSLAEDMPIQPGMLDEYGLP